MAKILTAKLQNSAVIWWILLILCGTQIPLEVANAALNSLLTELHISNWPTQLAGDVTLNLAAGFARVIEVVDVLYMMHNTPKLGCK